MTLRMVRAAFLASASVTLITAAAKADQTAPVETVVVTGTYVAGGADQAALPVNVLSADDIAKRGSPSMVDLMKTLPSSGGVVGDANPFTGGNTEGVSSVNLRGLSPSRTLVLINGRRIVTSATSPLLPMVDLNMIPIAAIGRIEILKDGAAATYGSEAVGGVVNIITKQNADGFQIDAGYKYLDGSAGDWTGGLSWGWSDDHVSAFLAGNVIRQSTLRGTARDSTTPKYTTMAGAIAAMTYNPQGGWSGASSANYLAPGTTLDPGDVADWSGMACTTRCYWRYVDFDNLIDGNDRYQGYGEVNVSFAHDIKLHIEGMYGQTTVYDSRSVTYLPTQFPGPFPVPAPPGFTPGTGPNSGSGASKMVAGTGFSPAQLATALSSANFFIPTQNPGFAALPTSTLKTAGLAAGGVFAGSLIWRPFTTGGNPFFGGGGTREQRKQDTYRLSSSLEGPLSFLGNDTRWNVAFTASQSDAYQSSPDFLIVREQLALEGLGSLNGQAACNPNIPGNAGNAAAGCYYLNPFSTGVAKNAITGAPNPDYDPATANDPRLLSWLYGNDPKARDSHYTAQSNQEFVVDAVLNGTLPWKFWGDNISWALGGQYRKDNSNLRVSGYTDQTATPCTDTILNGDFTCVGRDGPYGFYGNLVPLNLSGETKAAFGELDIPWTPDIQMQLAARYEVLPGGLNTFNPKVSLRWQLIDGLALRGSVGSTFRAPTLSNLSPNATRVLTLASQVTAYIPFITYGNGGKPAGTVGLSPEKAKSFDVGMVFDQFGFQGTVDYWHFDFQNAIGAESGNAILGAVFPSSGPSNCANPAYAALVSRIQFINGACALKVGGINNIGAVSVNYINNGPQQTHGVDLSVQRPFDDVIESGDNLTFDLEGSYIINYRVSAQTILGVTVFPKYDAAGGLNIGLVGPGSLPHVKGSFSANYTSGDSNLNLRMNLLGGMRDFNNPTRSSLFTTNQNGLTETAAQMAHGASVPPWATFDVAYQYNWVDQNLKFNLAIENILDKNPPFTRTDFSYDPFTANPYGRTVSFAITASL